MRKSRYLRYRRFLEILKLLLKVGCYISPQPAASS